MNGGGSAVGGVGDQGGPDVNLTSLSMVYGEAVGHAAMKMAGGAQKGARDRARGA